MKNSIFGGVFILILLLFTTGCSTLQVEHDYDDNYRFDSVKTFRVVHNVKPGENTLLNERITQALINTLQEKGYIPTTAKDADLVFVYHYGAKDKVDIQTDYQLIGYRRYGFGGPMIATTSTYEYTEGTIIVDAFDPKTDRIVFRSVGKLEVEYKKTPQEKRAYVQQIITKVMESFPKKEIK